MDEYISKEATIDAIKKIYCPQCKNYNGAMCRACEHMDDMDIIEDMPSADVQSVKHGRWISEMVRKPNWKGVEHDYFQPNSCSVCHTGVAVRSNFCPNCGADMGGDTNG